MKIYAIMQKNNKSKYYKKINFFFNYLLSFIRVFNLSTSFFFFIDSKSILQ